MNREVIEAVAADAAPAWHTLPVAEAGERLRSSARGLTTEDARQRLAEFGPNSIERIAIGYPFKKVYEPVITRGKVTEEVLEKCRELGRTIPPVGV